MASYRKRSRKSKSAKSYKSAKKRSSRSSYKKSGGRQQTVRIVLEQGGGQSLGAKLLNPRIMDNVTTVKTIGRKF